MEVEEDGVAGASAGHEAGAARDDTEGPATEGRQEEQVWTLASPRLARWT